MSTAFRNFILTFILAIILFVTLGYVFINDIYPTIKESDEEPEEIKVTDWTLPDNNQESNPDNTEKKYAFTEAFFCIDNRDALCASVVIHVDDTYNTCTQIIVPVDKHIEVAEKGSNVATETSIAEYYKKNVSADGVINDKILSVYKSITGYNIDKYFVISYQALKSIADFMPTTSAGAFSYTLQTDIKYKDPLYDVVSQVNPDAEKYVTEKAKTKLKITGELLQKLYSPGERDIEYPVVHSDSENEVSKLIRSAYKTLFENLFVSGKLAPTSTGTMTVASTLLNLIGSKSTNLSGSELGTYSKYLFASTDKNYTQHKIDYNSYLKGVGFKMLDWENAIADIYNAVKSK